MPQRLLLRLHVWVQHSAARGLNRAWERPSIATLFAAGDLPGMRLAADRVIAALRTLDYAGAPLWQQAQQRLLARLTAPPAGGGSGAGASCGEDTAAVDAEQLAAAVQAAVAATPAVPLEEEGLPYVEPKPKVGRGEVLWSRYSSAQHTAVARMYCVGRHCRCVDTTQWLWPPVYVPLLCLMREPMNRCWCLNRTT